jgi:hypothetical protein
MPPDAALSWVITVLITAMAGVVRLWGIGFPDAKQFDEVYYATEGGEILHNGGYENNPGYMFIVHPPLGKWLVAGGITVFGDNSVGWRVPAAIAGTLCVAILIRVTRRMTRSTLLGAAAGILLAADGLSIVQSRFALLDIFLAVFVLAGFACLVVDRDVVRDRLEVIGRYGGRIGFRGWRLAGGVLLGLSCGVKWSGIWFLVGFGLLSVLWDLGARRAAGMSRPWQGTALRDLPGAAGSFVLAPVAAYLLSWSGWFLGENSYDGTGPTGTPATGPGCPGRSDRCSTTTRRCGTSTARCAPRTPTSPRPGAGWSTAGRCSSTTRATRRRPAAARTSAYGPCWTSGRRRCGGRSRRPCCGRRGSEWSGGTGAAGPC